MSIELSTILMYIYIPLQSSANFGKLYSADSIRNYYKLWVMRVSSKGLSCTVLL